jgi:hypothetical protein
MNAAVLCSSSGGPEWKSVFDIRKETNQSADRLGKFDGPVADRAMFRADLPADPGSWVFSKDKFVKYERSVRRRDSSLELAGKEKQLRYSAAVTNVTE